MSAQGHIGGNVVNLPAMIGWEYDGALMLQPFRVDTELLHDEYDGDLVVYVQEVYAPPGEWRFEW